MQNTKIILNEDQQQLIERLKEFMKNDERIFLISGQAGVGKTTCVKFFLESINYKSMNICCCGPTNKSTRVLRDSISLDGIDYRTIYSLLGLRLAANGAIKEIHDTGTHNVSTYDLIVCDEGSMIKEMVLDQLETKTLISDAKIIIIGDREQLEPVKETESMIWNRYQIKYSLDKVMRHQNSILTYVQSVRENPNPKFVSTGDEVEIHEEQSFMTAIEDRAKKGLFHAGTCKAIAWRNVTVDFLNDYIRTQITQSKDDWVSGDRIVFTSPLQTNGETVASTDDEGIVKSVRVANHPRFPMYKVNELVIDLDVGSSVIARVVHPSSVKPLKEYMDDLANKKLWKSFWDTDDAFAKLSYGYAITAHRSQGSTFDEIFVDAGDILMNRDVSNRTKCYYVAVSRASKKLNIFP